MKTGLKELSVRFLIGGLAVTLSYVLAVGSPWRLLGGAFAAFPAVMISAIIITGLDEDSAQVGKVARGAVFGMLGGLVCVCATLLCLTSLSSWILSILFGLASWFIASLTIYKIFHKPD